MKNNLPIPVNEKERLEALLQYNILDTEREDEFDTITKLASYICQTPICLISLLDENRQWFKSSIGLDVPETPRDISFCQYAIMDDGVYEVPNALENDTFKNNPLVTGFPDIRFYAGTPLKNANGFNIGTLCVIDKVPRTLNPEQKDALQTLGKQVITQLELKQKNKELKFEFEKLAKTQFEKKLNEEKYQVFFDNSQGLMCTHDLKGKFLSLNDAAAQNLGYSKDELIGKTIYDIVLKEWFGGVDSYLKELTEKGCYSGLMKVLDKNGIVKTWYYKNTLLAIDTENPYVIGNAIDMTERIELEQKMKKAKELAEQAVYAKDSFLANMSHEIRTPMNAIIGFTDLLAQSNLDSKQRSHVQNVKTAGDNLLLIINDILDLSKIESGKLPIDALPFSVKKTLKNVQELLKYKCEEKKLECNFYIEANIPEYLTGDSNRLNQIMINLVGNAIKFTNKGSVTVSVKAIREDENSLELLFSVKDTGIGIPAEKLSIIFDRFTQANNDTTRKFGGTGLGLNIAQSLVRLQGGEMQVKSEEGKGSEFSFNLIYGKVTEPIIEPVKNNFLDRKTMDPVKILLCEDNALNQYLAEIVIETFGFQLDIASNGVKGIELLKINTYDLILMDLQMPELDGYQTTEIIRNKLNLNIPIIAMTAHSLAGEKEKCLEIGMNEYVPKPFKQEELYQKIVSVLPQKVNPGVLPGHAEQKVTDEQHGIVNLNYLKELSLGNKTFEREMIQLFIHQMPTDFAQLKKTIDEKDYKEMKAIAHKIQSSLSLMGLDDLKPHFKHFEKDAVEERVSNTTIVELKKINHRLDQSYLILKTLLAEKY